MRPLVTGVWLTHITNMIVTVRDESDMVVGRFDKDTPSAENPISEVVLDLDGLGLLIRGHIELSQRYFQAPYSLTFLVTLVDEIEGEVNVGEGFQEVISFQGSLTTSGVEIKPFDELDLKNEYTGALPYNIPGITLGTYNISPGATNYDALVDDAYKNALTFDGQPVQKARTKDGSQKTEVVKSLTNEEVLNVLTSNEPRLTFGVDGYRRAVIGLPEAGFPTEIQTNQCLDVLPSNHIINPYTTMVRYTGDKGWRSYTFSRGVGRLTPRVFKDMGAPKTEEVECNIGPKVLVNEVILFTAAAPVETPQQST